MPRYVVELAIRAYARVVVEADSEDEAAVRAPDLLDVFELDVADIEVDEVREEE